MLENVCSASASRHQLSRVRVKTINYVRRISGAVIKMVEAMQLLQQFQHADLRSDVNVSSFYSNLSISKCARESVACLVKPL